MPSSSDDLPPGLWDAPSSRPGLTLTPRPDVPEAVRGSRVRLAISRIDPDPRNPRAPTDTEVDVLARSIRSDGLLQPILVRPNGERYVIVAGHRRFAAWCRCATAAPAGP